MAHLLHVELVTPEKKIFSDEVAMVVVPAAEGDMGIMAQHSNIVAMLRAGMIAVHEEGGAVQTYYADGGYVSVSNNHCIILAEAVVPEAELRKELLLEKMESLKAEIERAECNDVQRELLQSRLIEAENALLLAH
jgi:F-type H+-transporting ATPase subunit epsilon